MTGFENGQDAYKTVPFGKSIACSTPEAVAWDPEWEKSVGDISGRAVAVHDSSDGFDLGKDSEASTSSSSSSSSSSSYSSSARAETVTVAAMNNNTASRRARHSRRLSRVGARRGSFRSTTKALGFISQAAQRMSSSAYAFV